MKKQHLSSGEIADICNINKKTLFYYDKIDLFKPAIIETNGYRYYTTDQIDYLSKIKALQSVGFSLKEIKQQLHVESISEGITTLNQQKQKIEEKANELLAVKEALSVKISALEHFEQIGLTRIFIKEFIEEWLRVEKVSPGEEIRANYLLDGHHFGVMLNAPDDSTEEIKIAKYQRTNENQEGDFKKEKGRYAGMYFISGEEQIIADALKAFALIKRSGYSLGEKLFVKDIANDFIAFQNGKIPFQISVQIKDNPY